MNIVAAPSEFSGDCESGWTVYLEQSFLSPNKPRNTKFVDAKSGFVSKGKNISGEKEEDEEEEDLSMVSDASSGPPHYNEDEGYFNYDNGYFYPSLKDTTSLVKSNGGQKKKEHRRRRTEQDDQEVLPSLLDDTASSVPAFNFSDNTMHNNFGLTNNNQTSMESALDYSQGFSATHFQGRSTYQAHIGYIHPSLSENQLQNNQWF